MDLDHNINQYTLIGVVFHLVKVASQRVFMS